MSQLDIHKIPVAGAVKLCTNSSLVYTESLVYLPMMVTETEENGRSAFLATLVSSTIDESSIDDSRVVLKPPEAQLLVV